MIKRWKSTSMPSPRASFHFWEQSGNALVGRLELCVHLCACLFVFCSSQFLKRKKKRKNKTCVFPPFSIWFSVELKTSEEQSLLTETRCSPRYLSCYNHFSRTCRRAVLWETLTEYWFSHILEHFEFQLITKIKAKSLSSCFFFFFFSLREPPFSHFYTSNRGCYRVCLSETRVSRWGRKVSFPKTWFETFLWAENP